MVNNSLNTQAKGDPPLAGEAFDALTPPERLAIAYAPARWRPYWVDIFELDSRFARIVAQASEPMLAQLRLAWWRENFDKPADAWPSGEPLLARLAAWNDERAALSGLAEGWEALVGEGALDVTDMVAFADGRAGAMAALARISGAQDDGKAAHQAGFRWALADLAGHLTDGAEREGVTALLAGAEPVSSRLSRPMRPLAALRAMAERAAGDGRHIGGGGDFLAAVRAGLTGR
ncbi:hypothetical protein [Croceicoccus mobilis]|uniref:Phytoene synthase n=1 Tax=Croceicoccus mobilis TaxID=1703339 RepID=A0A917DRB8_9SPHN|nr:hypothetical protein [Croceicoccus mobilis]GGD63641.1 hypothetical protein GCM10010990_11410 [Croceicoccus mobilis]